MSIFKSSFVPEIKTQLNVRQKAIATRDVQKLYQLNSRNAWIKMTSSVNVGGTNELAKKYVLQGGVLDNGKLNPGGIGNSYTSYSSRGIRPMPGITMVDIKSKSSYGSLREAIVSFSCNSIEQLEDLELLYMRPGYTVLLEWGWLPYLNNDGKLISILSDLNENSKNSVLNGGNGGNQISMSSIFQDLFQRSKDLNGNYDALFGKVSNYSWSARPDGGYDCQTTLISIGEVIESLKVNAVPLDIDTISKNKILGLKYNKLSLNPKELSKAYSNTKLNGLLLELKRYAEDQLEVVEKNNKTAGITYAGTAENSSGEKYDLVAMRLASVKETKSADNLASNKVKTYITLESLTTLLNKHVILAIEQTTGSYEPIAKISVQSNPAFYDSKESGDVTGSLLCLAHPYQVSVDIDTCIITNNKWAKGQSPLTGTKITPTNNTAKGAVPNFQAVVSAVITALAPAIPKITNPVDADNAIKPIGNISVLAYLGNKIPINDDAVLNEFSAILYKNIEAEGNKDPSKKDSIIDAYYSILNNTNSSFPKVATGSNSAKISIISRAFDKNDGKDALSEKVQKTNLQAAEVAVPVRGYLELLGKAVDKDKLKKFQLDGSANLGVIGNIYVSIDMLERLVSSNNVGSDKREVQLYPFLKTVLSKIQESIGNVNNFDIHVDPADGNVGRIIDINFTVPKNKKLELLNDNTNTKAFLIEIGSVGPTSGSIVRSYNLQSQIFPNQSALIAIGAQVKNGGEQGTQNHTLLSFNNGITDRNLPAKVDPKTQAAPPKPDESKKILENNINILSENLFPTTAQITVDKNGVDSIAETSKYKNALRDIISYAQGITSSPSKSRNIIPIQLSLTIDGIGGIIIGNLFKISDNVLPRGYKFENNVGSKLVQTVIGLSHKIENNDWTTTIDAYNIILDNEEEEKTVDPSLVAPPATPVANTTGDRIVPDPPFAPNGLRYPFDGRFTFNGGLGDSRAGGSRAHGGIDLGIAAGTSIYAVADGKVGNSYDEFTITDPKTGKQSKNAGGTEMVIYHSSGPLAGKSTLYSHLRSRNVEKDAIVKQGDLIGYSNNTGISGGDHLHFEVRAGKDREDPGNYFPLFKKNLQ
jgi:murein DD-endopeptidase MepM/ murein hydrolase activator NlpD